jgi:hypothetical protein
MTRRNETGDEAGHDGHSYSNFQIARHGGFLPLRINVSVSRHERKSLSPTGPRRIYVRLDNILGENDCRQGAVAGGYTILTTSSQAQNRIGCNPDRRLEDPKCA